MISSCKQTVKSCQLLELPTIKDTNGVLSPIHGSVNVPFDINRLFYLYDIPGGESRGAHAHIACHQFLIAGSGSFEVVVDDGTESITYYLSRPSVGLYVPPGIWASENKFSSGAICLVLASHQYDAKDYIREYKYFLDFKNKV